jgi:hypothetical protein
MHVRGRVDEVDPFGRHATAARADATYRVWVHGFATDGPDSHFTLFDWVLGSAAAGNMTVLAPASATLGTSGTVSLNFSGLGRDEVPRVGGLRRVDGAAEPDHRSGRHVLAGNAW